MNARHDGNKNPTGGMSWRTNVIYCMIFFLSNNVMPLIAPRFLTVLRLLGYGASYVPANCGMGTDKLNVCGRNISYVFHQSARLTDAAHGKSTQRHLFGSGGICRDDTIVSEDRRSQRRPNVGHGCNGRYRQGSGCKMAPN